MNCDSFRNRIHEHLRGGLSKEERDEVERHAEECSDCGDHRTSCQELTCREFVNFLHAYIDQDLSAERLAVFDRHLSVCPDCTGYLDGYRKTMGLSVAALSELSEREIPEDLVKAILEARKRS